MSIWGRKVDALFSPNRAPESVGWRSDPERPGVQRYWLGDGWDDTIPPRSTPEPSWKQARVVVLGILIAVAVIFTIWRMSQPSDLDCLLQEMEVTTGERLFVESACVGR